MTASVLPANYNDYLIRSFLHVAGTPILNQAQKAVLAALCIPQHTIKSPANIRIAAKFGKANDAAPVLKPEQIRGLITFYKWQITIGSLEKIIRYDWFGKVGLNFREKQRAGTRARLAREVDARMRVRAS